MNERTQRLYRVSHPVHGEAEVYASDRYFAVTAAAKEWGIRWSTIARECRVQELEGRRVVPQTIPAADASRGHGNNQGGKRHGKADKTKQRDH